jgi:hypothetical protein
MARQRGPFHFTGRIGDLSCYEDKRHGYIVRLKGGPTREQVKKRKSMAVVRQNNSEFGRASAYGALIRNAFRPLVLHCREYSMSRRLQSLITSVIKMDGSHEPGKRDLTKENLAVLQDFELNEHLSYRKFFKKDVEISTSENGVSSEGVCTLSKAFTRKADCYKVVSVLAAVDFKKKRFVHEVKESELLPCKGSRRFVFEHSTAEAGWLFYGLVVCFYRKEGKQLTLITEDDMKAGFVSFVG